MLAEVCVSLGASNGAGQIGAFHFAHFKLYRSLKSLNEKGQAIIACPLLLASPQRFIGRLACAVLGNTPVQWRVNVRRICRPHTESVGSYVSS